ncbi:MAG: sporulation protein YqfD [Bacilli bacterium]|uniref:sporulation protein YqfD n=1 Tax=unclassified Ureibacillus TaxID=2638520 RepID=UPI001ED4A473|nr:stage IV sporulation protein [Bacilli bacterium]
MKLYDRRPVEIRMSRNEKVHEFIRRLQQNRVKIRELEYLEDEVKFEISKKDVSTVRKLRKKYRLKVSIRYLQESRIFQNTGWTMFGLALLVIIPILCSQFIWKVEVEAETPELAVKVEKVLDEKIKLNRPLLKRNLVSDFEIRQIIMEQIRDLSWVHIIKKGSSITIVPQLAPITEVKENKPDRLYHLVAAKSGVITHFDITSGERRVMPNTTVYKGDVLVSGVIQVGEDEYLAVGAKGEVYADYWLETNFEIPRKVQYISATERKWTIEWKNKEEKEKEQSLQKVNLPRWISNYIEVKKTQSYTTTVRELSEEQIDSFILPLLHEKILRSLPPKTIIKKENILHVTFDDDKVKGKVLFLVNENIAKEYPIDQGD